MATSGPKFVIPEFDGTQSANFETWLKEFERKFTANAWPQERKAETLAGYLKGQAELVYSSLEEEDRADYARLVQGLRTHLRSKDRLRLSKQQFDARNQLLGESVSAYAVALSKLSETALSFMTQPAERDEALRDRFVGGLRASLREHVVIMNPATFHETLIGAERVETARNELTTTTRASATVGTAAHSAVLATPAPLDDKLDIILKSLQQLGSNGPTPKATLTAGYSTPAANAVQAVTADIETTPAWAKGLVSSIQSAMGSGGTEQKTAPTSYYDGGSMSTMRGPQQFTTNGRLICQLCNKVGHSARECRSAGNNSSRYCTFHQRYGHSTEECRDRQSFNQPRGNPNRGGFRPGRPGGFNVPRPAQPGPQSQFYTWAPGPYPAQRPALPVTSQVQATAPMALQWHPVTASVGPAPPTEAPSSEAEAITANPIVPTSNTDSNSEGQWVPFIGSVMVEDPNAIPHWQSDDSDHATSTTISAMSEGAMDTVDNLADESSEYFDPFSDVEREMVDNVITARSAQETATETEQLSCPMDLNFDSEVFNDTGLHLDTLQRMADEILRDEEARRSVHLVMPEAPLEADADVAKTRDRVQNWLKTCEIARRRREHTRPVRKQTNRKARHVRITKSPTLHSSRSSIHSSSSQSYRSRNCSKSSRTNRIGFPLRKCARRLRNRPTSSRRIVTYAGPELSTAPTSGTEKSRERNTDQNRNLRNADTSTASLRMAAKVINITIQNHCSQEKKSNDTPRYRKAGVSPFKDRTTIRNDTAAEIPANAPRWRLIPIADLPPPPTERRQQLEQQQEADSEDCPLINDTSPCADDNDCDEQVSEDADIRDIPEPEIDLFGNEFVYTPGEKQLAHPTFYTAHTDHHMQRYASKGHGSSRRPHRLTGSSPKSMNHSPSAEIPLKLSKPNGNSYAPTAQDGSNHHAKARRHDLSNRDHKNRSQSSNRQQQVARTHHHRDISLSPTRPKPKEAMRHFSRPASKQRHATQQMDFRNRTGESRSEATSDHKPVSHCQSHKHNNTHEVVPLLSLDLRDMPRSSTSAPRPDQPKGIHKRGKRGKQKRRGKKTDGSSSLPEDTYTAAARPSYSSRSGARRDLLWYSVCTFTILACLVTPLTAKILVPNPLICQTKQQGKIWRFPDAVNCSRAQASPKGIMYDTELQLYKHNIVQYSTPPWLCQKVTKEIRVFSYFFNDENLKEEQTTQHTVTGSECDAMLKYGNCDAGQLQPKGNIWATNNELQWEYPGGGINCCKWKSFTATNCFRYNVHVYKRHRSNEMESTAGDVSHCHYRDGHCSLSDGQFLSWKPNLTERCEFVPWTTMKGLLSGRNWLSQDGQLALTLGRQRKFHDCSGQQLRSSEQGIPFRLLRKQPTFAGQRKASLNPLLLSAAKNKNRSPRKKRSKKRGQIGVVTWELLAASLQAVELRYERQYRFSFNHAFAAACHTMRTLTEATMALIIANPTIAMRQLLHKANIFARSGGSQVEVWPCVELQNSEFSLRPMNTTCTQEIPITTRHAGRNNTGYLDPITNIIQQQPGPVTSCGLNSEVPISLRHGSFLYHRQNGSLQPLEHFWWMRAFQNNMSLHALPKVIFHPIVMYQLDEFQSHVSLNDILGGLSRQQEVLSLLGVHTALDNPSDNAQMAAAHIVNRGIFSFLTGINLDPKQMWIFACCIYTTGSCFYRFLWKPKGARQRIKRLTVWAGTPFVKVWQFLAQLLLSRQQTYLMTTLQAQSQLRQSTPMVTVACDAPSPIREARLHQSPDFQPYPLRSNAIGMGNTMIIPVSLEGLRLEALFDTGSQVTLMSDSALAKLNKSRTQAPQVFTDNVTKMVSVTGHLLPILGSIKATLQIGDKSFTGEISVVKGLHYDLLIGENLIREMGPVCIDLNKKRLTFQGNNDTSNQASQSVVRMCATTTIPPLSQCVLKGSLTSSQNGEVVLFTPMTSTNRPRNLVAAHSIVTVDDVNIPVRIVNPTNAPLKVYSGSRIGTIEQLDQHDIIRLEPDARISAATVQDDMVNPTPLAKMDFSKCAFKGSDLKSLQSLLEEYAEMFAEGDHDLGCNTAISHQVDTGENRPIRQRPYRTAYRLREVVTQKINEMLGNEVIQPSTSEWASPIVLVKKKDGSWRFCCDYRKLNSITRKDAYPLKRMDDILMSMGKAKYFSSLDLQSGYHQVLMHPQDREKTAFVTHEGLYEYLKMPFGLCNAPATFQRMMENVLSGLDWKTCLVYLDDICIFGETPEEHNGRLRQVLQRLQIANLKLKPSKCVFGRSTISFLGHTLSADGLFPECSKTSKIVDWPTPTNEKEVMSFLGLAGYYRTFVSGFSKIAAPLHAITQKKSKFAWTAECKSAFEKLKKALSEPPILVFPDFRKPFILQTDACDVSIGAVLSQIADDGKEHPIAFASRLLNKAERKYPTVEKEALGVVHGVEHFRPYIYGNQTIVITDPKPLKWLLTVKNPDGKLARWAIALQSYDLSIHHRSGKTNTNADALSRRPANPENSMSQEITPCEICNKMLNEARVTREMESAETVPHVYAISTDHSTEIREQQRSDPELMGLICILEEEGSFSENDPLAKRHAEFQLKEGILYRAPEDTSGPRGRTKSQLVLPHQLRKEALLACHDHLFGGHLGIRKTYHKVSSRYWWPSCMKDVKAWCAACETCASRKGPQRKIKPPLQPIPATAPWHKVACDIIGPLPLTRGGNKYVVVFMDYFTKWPECFPVPDTKSTRLARLFVEEIICRFGVPAEFLTDQGQNLVSEVIQEVCRLLNVKKLQTAAYHPQCDGMVERFNRTLESMLAAYVNNGQDDWDPLLPYVLLAYRSSVHETTRETPFFLNMGRDPALPLDLSTGVTNPVYVDLDDYKNEMASKLQFAWDQARSAIQDAQAKQKRHYDKSASSHTFLLGDRVYLRSPLAKKGKSPKLHRSWHGPFRIITLTEDGTGATIIPCHHSSRKPPVRVNVQRLKFAPTAHQYLSRPTTESEEDGPGATPVEEVTIDPECDERDRTHLVNAPAPSNVSEDDDVSRYNLRRQRSQLLVHQLPPKSPTGSNLPLSSHAMVNEDADVASADFELPVMQQPTLKDALQQVRVRFRRKRL